NTLDTTVTLGGTDADPDTFLVTGDIPAMWLRDSAAQVLPYVALSPRDPALRRLLAGVIARQARSIRIDPYANAFMADPAAPTSLDWAKSDHTEMRPGVAARKWEVDSLLWPMRLAARYWAATGDRTPFGGGWRAAMALAVETLVVEQQGTGPYRFQRLSTNPNETLANDGAGPPARAVGLIRTAFRASDDAAMLPFSVPGNRFAVSALVGLAGVLDATGDTCATAARARALAATVDAALARYGTMRLPSGETVLAYEVDGFGGAVFLDEPNLPSLTGLAYLGAARRDDPLFRRTLAAAWRPANPWFTRGTAGAGIASPHTPAGRIWPLATIARAFAHDDDGVIRDCLRVLKAGSAATGLVHESFDPDRPATITRPWFAWANSFFGDLVLDLAGRKPALLAAPLA
ncbi:MAG: glycoside hydrolase family 125 protein, partial [Sphingomonadaceae bacterium]|nr:glycoside hydrolase family 125 protein [Sphingomonadaceae bacterium]